MHNCVWQCFKANWHPQSTVFQSKYNHYNYICHLLLKQSSHTYLPCWIHSHQRCRLIYFPSFYQEIWGKNKKKGLSEWHSEMKLHTWTSNRSLPARRLGQRRDRNNDECSKPLSLAFIFQKANNERGKVLAYCYKFSSICQ